MQAVQAGKAGRTWRGMERNGGGRREVGKRQATQADGEGGRLPRQLSHSSRCVWRITGGILNGGRGVDVARCCLFSRVSFSISCLPLKPHLLYIFIKLECIVRGSSDRREADGNQLVSATLPLRGFPITCQCLCLRLAIHEMSA